jgi:uncharacterized membrane protein
MAGGTGHFVGPEFYAAIVPPFFPSPMTLVVVSGLAEIAGGVGLLTRRWRRAAGWGLLALLVAVYPANIYMALHPERYHFPAWALWARLPLQFVFMGWVWAAAIHRPVNCRAEVASS